MQRVGQPGLQGLQRPADGPRRQVEALGHVIIVQVLQFEIDDLTLPLVQRRQNLLQLVGEFDGSDRVAARIDRVEVTGVAAVGGGVVERRLLSDAPLAAGVEAGLLRCLGQGNGAQNLSQAVAVGQLELATAGPPQEGAAGRLNHVLGADAAAHLRRQVFVGTALELRPIARADLEQDRLVAAAQPLDKALPLIRSVRVHGPSRLLGTPPFQSDDSVP
jgi:hypothetical protein